MGTLRGHVFPGLAFFLLGLWQLINNIKLYILNPNSYTSIPWFPTAKMRYLELYFIMMGSSASILMELFVGPSRHQPLDTDGTIPTYHLHNFEHASISFSFLVYAAFAILHDKISHKAQHGLTLLFGAVALGQELYLFHVHSTDHQGIEGQYHLLLQLIVLVSLSTTLMAIGLPRSFLVSFVRSVSIMFQGLWLIVIGYMLWTPAFVPKGCFLQWDDGHQVMKCSSEGATHRAKSLVNLQFSWYTVGITALAMYLYLAMVQIYGKDIKYSSLPDKECGGLLEEGNIDVEVEPLKKGQFGENLGRGLAPFDMER